MASNANMKGKYFNKIQELTSSKAKNCTSIFKSQYEDVVQRLNELHKGAKKCSTDYSLISRYQLRQISLDGGTCQTLVKRDTDLQIVALEDLYDIIEEAHLSTGHGGRDTIQNTLNKKYANVTKEQITAFLEICENCQLKKCQARKHMIVKPVVYNELKSRCKVDLIDMQSQPDGKFRFILDYQDHLTKIVRLRALETETAKETAHHLVEIFCELGAPLILQSGSGREFAKQLVKEVLSYWSECRLVHGKSRHSPSLRSAESTNRDIEESLALWQKENNTSRWSDGLKFVQWKTNARLHSGIEKSPYKAMFGREPHLGMSAIRLPKAVITKVETEEDLANALGSAIAEETEQNSSREPTNPCVSCDKASSGAYHCKDCGLTCHPISPCSIADSDSNESVICRNCAPRQDVEFARQSAKKRQCIQTAQMLENFANKRLRPAEISVPTRTNVPIRKEHGTHHQNPIEICETQLEMQDDSTVTRQTKDDMPSRTDDVRKGFSETFDYAILKAENVQLQKQVDELQDRLHIVQDELQSMQQIQEAMFFVDAENAELRQQITRLEAENELIKQSSVYK